MLTIGDLDRLPPTINVQQTAGIWGCSTWALYEQAKAGTCPVAPLRLGRCLRWPTALVLRSIGIEPVTSEPKSDPAVLPGQTSGDPTKVARAVDHLPPSEESKCIIPTG